MRAIVFDGAPAVVEREEPEVKPGEALVRVRVAGICNTDLEVCKGYMGFRGVLGHEFVGTVESAADARWIGKRVVGEINCGCGECEACRAGDSRHCANRTVLGILRHDGAFAEHVVLPTRNLHEVPGTVPDEAAVFTEPLAAACEIGTQVALDPSKRVVVLGDGKLGLLIAMAVRATGARVLAVGKHADKLALLQGIETMLLADWRPDGTADVVVEATGSSAGLDLALQAVRPRGTVVLKTTVADQRPMNLAPIVIKEITVVGSRCGPFPTALDLLRTGAVDPRPLVTDRFPLDHGVRALQRATEPGVLKVLLTP